jgi:4-alpha-glucanotransferase
MIGKALPHIRNNWCGGFERLQPDWAVVRTMRRFGHANGDSEGLTALFRAAKDRYKGLPWTQWPQGLRERRPVALDELRRQEGAAVERTNLSSFFFQTGSTFEGLC